MPSGTQPVLAGAVSVVVLGAFGASYVVDDATPSWLSEVSVSAKTPTSFTLTFNTPAPAAGGQVDWSVNTASVVVASTGLLLAGTIVNNVRDDIPDPVYDVAGNPLPDADGLQRASTMYRWLNEGVKRAARLMGSLLVDDWIALAQTAFQPWYAVDPKWTKIVDGFSNQWPIDNIVLTERDVIWPSTSITPAQSLYGYYRSKGPQLQFGLWPVPATTDQQTTLVVDITAASPDPIRVVSTAGWLSFGYFKVEDEIIQYQRLVTGPIGAATISRGVCGTTAAAHLAGTTVRHLGLWLKGPRQPATVVNSNSVIELPGDVAGILEMYLLARCRGSEEEYDERTKIMAEFDNACKGVRADPDRKQNSWQVRAWGEAAVGPLIWSGSTVRP